MSRENKVYITASELAETLGVSLGKAYALLRALNEELKKEGYITVAGKCPRAYLEKKWYGYTAVTKR